MVEMREANVFLNAVKFWNYIIICITHALNNFLLTFVNGTTTVSSSRMDAVFIWPSWEPDIH